MKNKIIEKDFPDIEITFEELTELLYYLAKKKYLSPKGINFGLRFIKMYAQEMGIEKELKQSMREKREGKGKVLKSLKDIK